MLLSIIIISYNTKELLEQCLESIRNSFQNKDKISNSKSQISSKSQIPNQQLSPDNVEVIVVDNNSSDGSQEYLKQLTVKNSRLKVKVRKRGDNLQRSASRQKPLLIMRGGEKGCERSTTRR